MEDKTIYITGTMKLNEKEITTNIKTELSTIDCILAHHGYTIVKKEDRWLDFSEGYNACVNDFRLEKKEECKHEFWRIGNHYECRKCLISKEAEKHQPELPDKLLVDSMNGIGCDDRTKTINFLIDFYEGLYNRINDNYRITNSHGEIIKMLADKIEKLEQK